MISFWRGQGDYGAGPAGLSLVGAHAEGAWILEGSQADSAIRQRTPQALPRIPSMLTGLRCQAQIVGHISDRLTHTGRKAASNRRYKAHPFKPIMLVARANAGVWGGLGGEDGPRLITMIGPVQALPQGLSRSLHAMAARCDLFRRHLAGRVHTLRGRRWQASDLQSRRLGAGAHSARATLRTDVPARWQPVPWPRVPA